uniref:Carbonic anhydrase n=1 Tax=Strigamia maritima TaxID=126957 RepID=T1IZQ6_STRMM
MVVAPQHHVGIVKVLRGIIRYRHIFREKMVRQFQIIKDDPHPDAVFFTCIDSRMIPTRFTMTNVGDMLITRNAGNLIPHASSYDPNAITTEPAALELGCVINNIKDVIVCGHSDCKAIGILHGLRDPATVSLLDKQVSPLKAWLCRHAASSFRKFDKLKAAGFKEPLEFQSETPMRRFVAYIDPENKFEEVDKLSQVNVLQQVENIASYPFIKEGLVDGSIHIHAFWFDIYTGDLYYFSRQQKRFININEKNINKLIMEVG